MEIVYQGQGGMSLSGCALVQKSVLYTTRFMPGATVYVCKTASTRGFLEKVVIKKVKLVRNLGTTVALYYDTFNWLYNEYDLCTQNEAVALAIAYQERIIAACQEELRTCQLP